MSSRISIYDRLHQAALAGMTPEASAWHARSADLTAWTWQHLVNRTDVWGGYRSLPQRELGMSSQLTRPADPRARGSRSLRTDDLDRHFQASYWGLEFAPTWIVGLHTTTLENTCKWGCVDYDWHAEDSTAPDINWRTALAHYERLRSLGFHPLLTDSNGKGGFHQRVIFNGPTDSSSVFAFMGWLVSDFQKHGMTAPPEAFPKQPNLNGISCGNWVRTFGRHHTREHWSRVWDGDKGEWLSADKAIDFVLSLTGDQAGLIPGEAATFDRSTLRPTSDRPRSPRQLSFGGSPSAPSLADSADPLTRRIAAYMDHLPSGMGTGQGRTPTAFSFAAWLVRDLGLDDLTAADWLARWDAQNSTPLGSAKLADILRSAHRYGRNAYGSDADRPRSHRIHPELAREFAANPELLTGKLEFVGDDGAVLSTMDLIDPATRQPKPTTPSEFGAAIAAAALLSPIQLLTRAKEFLAIERAKEEAAKQQLADALASCPTTHHHHNPQAECQRQRSATLAAKDGSHYLSKILGCSRYSCCACRLLLIKRNKINVNQRLMADATPPISYRFYCSDTQWASCQRYLRSKRDANGRKGDYFRMATNGHVYSTVLPAPAFRSAVKEMDRQDVVTELHAALEAIPLDWSGKHPLTSSRGWSQPKHVSNSGNYHLLGKGLDGANVASQVSEIVQKYGIEPKTRFAQSIWDKTFATVIIPLSKAMSEERKKELVKELCPYRKIDGQWEKIDPDDLVFVWGDEDDGVGEQAANATSTALQEPPTVNRDDDGGWSISV